jgi:hypothetical protein
VPGAKHVPWLTINAVLEQKHHGYETSSNGVFGEIGAGLEALEYLNQHGGRREQTRLQLRTRSSDESTS